MYVSFIFRLGVMHIFRTKYKVSFLPDTVISFTRKTSNVGVNTNNRTVADTTVSREANYGIVCKHKNSNFPSSSLVDVSLLKTIQNILPSSLLSGTRRSAGKMLHSIVMSCGRSPQTRC